MIKLSNIKRTLLAGLMTVTLIGSTLTAYAENTTNPDKVVDGVADESVTFSVSQTWDNDGGKVDLTKVDTSVNYKVEEAPELTTDYTPDYTGVSLTPMSFELTKDKASQDLTFTADHAGVFTYKISVDETLDAGYTYDNYYIVRAYVKWNADRTGLITTITATQGSDTDKSTTVTFTHKYTPFDSGDADNEDGTKYDPPVQKTIKGDKTTASDTFQFKMVPHDSNDPDGYTLPILLDENGNPVLDENGNTITHDVVEITPDNSDPAKNIAEFGDLGFYKEGVYAFDVYEIRDGQNGYTYDDVVYTVIYTVSKVDAKDKDGNPIKEWKVVRTFEIDGKTTDSPLKTYEFINIYTAPDKGGDNGQGSDGYGSVMVYKVDAASDDVRLSGVRFEVTKTNGDYITTITTDDKGMASIPSLPVATYRLKELNTPAGYQAENRYVYFDVIKDSKVASPTNVKVTNTKAASVQHIVAIKQWANVEGITTPASVTLELTKDGVATGVTQIASAANNWTVDFGLVPSDAEYSIVENAIDDHYAVSYEKAVNGSDVIYTITNTYVNDDATGADHRNASTGDSSHMNLYAGMMGAAIICLAGWFVYTRKNKKN